MEPKKRSKLLRRIAYALVGLVIIAFLVTRIFGPPKQPEYLTEKAVIGDIVQTVDVTGTVEPANRYQLQFDQIEGKIRNIYVHEGDKVNAGDTLAVLENGDAILQLEIQKAGLRLAQANMAQALAGPKQEEINIDRLQVDLANVDLSLATQNQKNLLNLAGKNLELAALSVNQAQENYEQAQKNLQYAHNNGSLNDDYSELTLKKTHISYKQTGYDIDYNQSNLQQELNQAKESMLPLFHAFQDSLSGALQTIDSIIGAEQTSILGPAYEELDQQNLQYARDLYFQINNLQENFDNNVENLKVSSSITTFHNTFNQAKNLYTTCNNLHIRVRELLIGLPISNVYTHETHQALLQQLETSYKNIQQSYQTLLQADQNVQTLQNKENYTNKSGNYSTQLGQNTIESAALQHQMNQLTDQKTIEDAKSALQLAAIDLEEAKQNYNKTLLEYYRQADEINANIQKANIGVLTAEEQLNLLQSGELLENIAPLKVMIDQAWEQVHLAEYNLATTYLTAPVSGTIAAINGKAGESATRQQTLGESLIVLDASGLVIKALVPEADIPKIHFGDFVETDFDALGPEQKFYGHIIFIAPAETINQGVIYYEVKVQFDPKEANIKPGMTANMVVRANKKEKVLTIPIRAIQYEEDKPYVEVLVTKDKKKTVEKRTITTGLESDQSVEILSGLKEGDEVITFKEEQPSNE